MQLYLKDIAAILGISIENVKTQVSSFSVDSRTILDGGATLFFAISGDNNNGHDYLNEAYQKKVSAFVVEQLPSDIEGMGDAIFLVVNNSLRALQQVAAWYRAQYNIPVVGITGSNGKTIVKEWLFELLNDQFKIVRSPKSYNSQVGVPLSAMLLNEDAELGIFEAGISKPDEMCHLQPIIDPGVGIFTTITAAHQENFENITQKIREKLQLFEKSHTIIYCIDQTEVAQEITSFAKQQDVKMYGWSAKNNPQAAVLFNITAKEKGVLIRIQYNNKEADLLFPHSDKASVENICHCLTLLAFLGIDYNDVKEKVESIEPVAMRLEIKQGINNCLVINDSYNSDINSLSIALDVLERQTRNTGRKKTLILSDIQQSGLSKKELYGEVERLLKLRAIDRMIGIGADIAVMAGKYGGDSTFFSSTDDFIAHFSEEDFRDETILLKGARSFQFDQISVLLQEKAHQTVLEVNLSALADNLSYFRSFLKPETKLMAMVKAFSYGSGATEIARVLQFHRVDYLAVAIADEGVELRKAGITIPIVVMNPEVHSFDQMIEYRLEPNIYSFNLLKRFDESVRHNAAREFPVHLKVETGMNRLGIYSYEELREAINYIKESRRLFVRSVFSHLAVSDEPDQDGYTCAQIQRFEEYCQLVRDAFDYPVWRHLLNSSGIERFKDKQYEMVRVGIGLYGISSIDAPEVRNVCSLKTTVSQVRNVAKGDTVGYGRKGIVKRPSRIAILPIGYADGFDRRFGNGVGRVFVKNSLAPVIGNVCMDMCMIDVTGLDVKEGDRVELFGDHILLKNVAGSIDAITYEILTSVSQRVKRIYIQE